MNVIQPANFTAICSHCKAKIILRKEDISFKSATVKTCPVCSNRVPITSDYGLLLEDIRVTYERSAKEVVDGKILGPDNKRAI